MFLPSSSYSVFICMAFIYTLSKISLQLNSSLSKSIYDAWIWKVNCSSLCERGHTFTFALTSVSSTNEKTTLGGAGVPNTLVLISNFGLAFLKRPDFTWRMSSRAEVVLESSATNRMHRIRDGEWVRKHHEPIDRECFHHKLCSNPSKLHCTYDWTGCQLFWHIWRDVLWFLLWTWEAWLPCCWTIYSMSNDFTPSWSMVQSWVTTDRRVHSSNQHIWKCLIPHSLSRDFKDER